MNRGNMGKQISSAPKSKKVKKMFGGGMASMPTPMAGGARRPPMPPLGKPSIGGPGGGRPMPVPMPGGIRGTSGPKPATALVSQPGRTVSSAVPAEMQRAMPARMAKGGKIDGCCMKGKTKGKMC